MASAAFTHGFAASVSQRRRPRPPMVHMHRKEGRTGAGSLKLACFHDPGHWPPRRASRRVRCGSGKCGRGGGFCHGPRQIIGPPAEPLQVRRDERVGQPEAVHTKLLNEPGTLSRAPAHLAPARPPNIPTTARPRAVATAHPRRSSITSALTPTGRGAVHTRAPRSALVALRESRQGAASRSPWQERRRSAPRLPTRPRRTLTPRNAPRCLPRPCTWAAARRPGRRRAPA